MSKSPMDQSTDFNWRHGMLFLGTAVMGLALCLTLYAIQALRHIQPSPVPSTYKWFLLQEVPGPRLIIESGSNSHHGFDTDMISEALNITAINIADNAGYDLEQKIARLHKHTRRGDIIILPLEWSYYTREDLTDDFVDQLPALNRDYINAVSLWDKLQLALSLPPAAVLGFSRKQEASDDLSAMTPLQDFYVAALMRPTGHSAYEAARPPALGVSGKSCDEYLFWDSAPTLSKKFKRALKRLSTLKAKGVDVYFTWPIVVGDTCLSDTKTVNALVEQIEREVEKAGFEFLGRPTQSLYPLRYRDDTPYHLIQSGADLHTKRFIETLRQYGIRPDGASGDISRFARARVYELEYKLIDNKSLIPLPVDQALRVDDEAVLNYVDFAAGWWVFEPYGRWMRDHEAALRLRLPAGLRKGAHLQLSGIMAGFGTERANLILDGQVIGAGLLGGEHVLSVNLDEVPRDQDVLLKLRFPEMPEVLSPYDRGQNADKRTMSFHFQTLSLTSKPSQQPMPAAPPEPQIVSADLGDTIALNQSISLAVPASEALISFGEGWWDREPAGRWMGCCEASFSLDLPSNLPAETVLEISGDLFGGGAANIEATLNGAAPVQALYSRDNPLRLPLREIYQGQTLQVTLSFPDRVFESPKALGMSEDTRVMSAFITAIELSTS